jgi:GNAT superfamily N-acetyltransferase
LTLEAHLTTWLGKWPGDGQGLTVVGSSRRTEPGWDAVVHAVIGVASADGRGVLSVPPAVVDAVAAALAEGNPAGVPAAAGVGGRFFTGVFRWSTAPADLPDAGEWVAADDPSVPEWLRPFGGEVLVALDPDTGEHLSGVGIKRHDAYGQELAVVTRQAAEGRGLGRRLVAQAARRVLDEGAVPTYLHATDNHASAHLATAAGFPDVGWTIHGVGG